MRYITLLIVGFILSFDVYAENIKGTVIDESGLPLPFATVRIENKRIAALGDSLGNFNLQVGKKNFKDTLVISYVGYEAKEIPVKQALNDSSFHYRLTPQSTLLKELSVYPKYKGKGKIKKNGKKHNWAMLKSCLDGETAGECFGYEFHSGKNKKLFLSKVGFFYCEGDNQMTKMKFRINIYDMSAVKKSPTADFTNALSKPIYFDYELNGNLSGKFEYDLPECIELPKDVMVEIEMLENLGDKYFWYKSNLIGKQTWSRTLKDGVWEKNPFAAPFFIECIEVKD